MKKPQPPQDLWTAMDSLVGEPHKDDPGISIAEFAERYRLSYTSSLKRLMALVRTGKLIEGRRKRPDGRFVKVFRPA